MIWNSNTQKSKLENLWPNKWLKIYAWPFCCFVAVCIYACFFFRNVWVPPAISTWANMLLFASQCSHTGWKKCVNCKLIPPANACISIDASPSVLDFSHCKCRGKHFCLHLIFLFSSTIPGTCIGFNYLMKLSVSAYNYIFPNSLEISYSSQAKI